MISHLALHKNKSLSTFVSLQKDQPGAEYLVVAHPKFDATFALHGAHLLHFKLKDQAPLIWLSKTALFNEQNAIRGGVPICWPWFGAADEKLGRNLSAHGFARTSKWKIHNINEFVDGSGVEIEFILDANSHTLKSWPYSFELILKATLTETLQLQLISKNTGNQPFNYTAALHTYLNISAPKACHLANLSKEYINKLKNDHIENGDGSLQISGPIDAIYRQTADAITLFDAKFKRNIIITNTGNDSNVVWTPWIEGAKAFKDMPDDGYETMLCVESAITTRPGVSIQANETHILSTTIKSQTLA